jgi:hypothetical protein
MSRRHERRLRLDGVGGIDAALEPSVHTQPDHTLEAVAAAFDQNSTAIFAAMPGCFPSASSTSAGNTPEPSRTPSTAP